MSHALLAWCSSPLPWGLLGEHHCMGQCPTPVIYPQRAFTVVPGQMTRWALCPSEGLGLIPPALGRGHLGGFWAYHFSPSGLEKLAPLGSSIAAGHPGPCCRDLGWAAVTQKCWRGGHSLHPHPHHGDAGSRNAPGKAKPFVSLKASHAPVGRPSLVQTRVKPRCTVEGRAGGGCSPSRDPPRCTCSLEKSSCSWRLFGFQVIATHILSSA